MAEVELSNAPKTPGTAGMEGGSVRPHVVDRHCGVRVPRDRIGTVEAMNKQEDWLHTATADPAFWLKEIS